MNVIILGILLYMWVKTSIKKHAAILHCLTDIDVHIAHKWKRTET